MLLYNFKSMPVKKTTRKKTSSTTRKKSTPVVVPTPPERPKHHSFVHGGEFTHRIFMTLFGILLVYLIFWVGTLIRNNIEEYYYIGQADTQERTITLEGEATVTATPDIAMTTIGMVATGETVAAAQAANTAVMNQLTARLGELGIAESDMQTANYNIYPQYNYTEEEGRLLEGYEVSQSVRVMIRNVDNAKKVIALAGEVGANSVSGLQFTIDNTDVYVDQARDEALDSIYAKAKALSQSLGVSIVSVVSYNEYNPGGGPVYASAKTLEYGMGGAEAPDVQAGSMDVGLHVSVTFEIQ